MSNKAIKQIAVLNKDGTTAAWETYDIVADTVENINTSNINLSQGSTVLGSTTLDGVLSNFTSDGISLDPESSDAGKLLSVNTEGKIAPNLTGITEADLNSAISASTKIGNEDYQSIGGSISEALVNLGNSFTSLNNIATDVYKLDFGVVAEKTKTGAPGSAQTQINTFKPNKVGYYIVHGNLTIPAASQGTYRRMLLQYTGDGIHTTCDTQIPGTSAIFGTYPTILNGAMLAQVTSQDLTNNAYFRIRSQFNGSSNISNIKANFGYLCLYRDIDQPDPPQPLNNTSWKFNDYINPNLSSSYNINFTSNGNTYSGIRSYITYDGLSWIYPTYSLQYLSSSSWQTVYSEITSSTGYNRSWSSSNYQNVSITDGADANNVNLIKWFNSNATQVTT